MEYYSKQTGESNTFLALALSSRKNLCIHPEVHINGIIFSLSSVIVDEEPISLDYLLAKKKQLLEG